MNKSDSPILENHGDTPMLQDGRKLFSGGRQAGQRRGRPLAWAVSVAAHVLVFAALLWPRAERLTTHEVPSALSITFVNLSKPEPPGPPDDAKLKAGDPEPSTQPVLLQPTAPAPVKSITVTTVPDTSDLLSASQIAGATGVEDDGAGGGGGGGDCDTAKLVQRALRRDPLVRNAVIGANRLGKSVMLWNGDWVRSGEEEGKGLSAVREAIIWDLAFAPEACRHKREHGLILLSLADGTTRFAIGTSDWRWSDLLGLDTARAGR
jgi:hypothetical protein